MKMLAAAIALVFAAGVSLPGQVDARARDIRFNVFGGHILKLSFELDQNCGNPDCEDTDTFSYSADFFSRFQGSGKRSRPLVDSIRMTVRKDLPGQRRDKIVKRRTGRNVRFGYPLELNLGGCSSVDDPNATEYYAKVRIKRTKTSPAVWLRTKPVTPRLPWACGQA